MQTPNSASTSAAIQAARSRRPLTPCQRLLRRAERLAEQGRCAQALLSLERAIAAGADAYESALRIAERCRSQQEWRYALSAAEEAILLAPERLLGYEALTAIALEAGQYQRAAAASAALLKRAPRHLPALNALGIAYIQMGDVDAALRVMHTLIRLDPRSAAHHFKQGLLYQHKREIVLAMESFHETIRLEPDSPYASAAREALDTLDSYQIEQILMLATEDSVFLAKLQRDPLAAARERGFALSEAGLYALAELCRSALSDAPAATRPLPYN